MVTTNINLSFEEMWERIMTCDRKYDGLFFTAVKTTKIYCRPSCRSSWFKSLLFGALIQTRDR
ncbi:methylphosphotriester-DNA--protein-cysteine methyltransferase [Bacillus horti]|uniref:Methylphosphotriester-DNA--protein-cysteine methyltransferase n=1 Tax=Caldalkalibacillus horti TaxID=77523 RepID=A0ABT9W4M9_9BACI|nr:methylphosphotriester-DNA--protein-cysteine methyltransferase [Bacillus horti]